MKSQSSCPICTRPYTKTTRRQMMLCLNQHFLCHDCAQQISRKNSLCPFCNVRFDIKVIRPRRTHNEESLPAKTEKQKGNECTFCPSGHSFGKFTSLTTTCRKCREDSRGQWSCYTCGYIICKTCIEGNKDRKGVPKPKPKPNDEEEENEMEYAIPVIPRHSQRQNTYHARRESDPKQSESTACFWILILVVMAALYWKNRGP